MTADHPDEPLTITAGDRRGWTLVHLAGELDYRTVGELREYLSQRFVAGQATIALDLSALMFCDSMGVGCFVGAWKRARQMNGDLLLLRPNSAVRRMLAITGLERIIASADELPDRSGG